MIKMSWLSLLALVALVFISCGNEPPEGFYDGTPEDDTLINAVLDSHSELMKTDDIFLNAYVPVTLAAVTFPVADSYFKGESILINSMLTVWVTTSLQVPVLRTSGIQKIQPALCIFTIHLT